MSSPCERDFQSLQLISLFSGMDSIKLPLNGSLYCSGSSLTFPPLCSPHSRHKQQGQLHAMWPVQLHRTLHSEAPATLFYALSWHYLEIFNNFWPGGLHFYIALDPPYCEPILFSFLEWAFYSSQETTWQVFEHFSRYSLNITLLLKITLIPHPHLQRE